METAEAAKAVLEGTDIPYERRVLMQAVVWYFRAVVSSRIEALTCGAAEAVPGVRWSD